MRCATVRRLLDDHVDGVLPGDRAEQIRGHLDACPECDQEAELLRGVTTPLSAWGDLDPPADCFDRILERIDALPPEMHVPTAAPRSPTLHFLRGGARWIVTSGAVAAAVMAAAVLFDDAGAPSPELAPRVRAGAATAATAATAGVTMLRPGEMALTRTRFVITDDLEQRDGLRRERMRPSEVPGLRAVPVSADPLGASPR